MKNFLKKPYRWAIVFSALMILSFTYVMLDTFVIVKSYQTVATKTDSTQTVSKDNNSNHADVQNSTTQTSSSSVVSDKAAEATSNAVITSNSYKDDNISIAIDTVKKYNSTVYIADIQVSDISYLKTAFANDTYGRNIKDTTSSMASQNKAIFAINGDFYGFRDYGYVVRNGTLYRDNGTDTEDLVIDKKGDFSIINEKEVSIKDLDLSSIWQIFSFGPALINNGEIVVDENSEVARAMSSNPRTAIGEISPLHYVIVVSDGRTSESTGLSLLELAQIFSDKGCTTAYNLDGGGSSTMYFNGKVVNKPTDGFRTGEREVSDIAYIGY